MKQVEIGTDYLFIVRGYVQSARCIRINWHSLPFRISVKLIGCSSSGAVGLVGGISLKQTELTIWIFFSFRSRCATTAHRLVHCVDVLVDQSKIEKKDIGARLQNGIVAAFSRSRSWCRAKSFRVTVGA